MPLVGFRDLEDSYLSFSRKPSRPPQHGLFPKEERAGAPHLMLVDGDRRSPSIVLLKSDGAPQLDLMESRSTICLADQIVLRKTRKA